MRARDNARGLAILVWVNGRRFNVHQSHRARRSWESAERNSRVCGTPAEVSQMLDFVMIAMGVGFFAAAILYVLACERM
jgi:hypothetical protein